MRKARHDAIRDLLVEVITEVAWQLTPDGLDRIDDKGIRPQGALRQVIIDVLHIAKEHQLDSVGVLGQGALGFALQCGSNSKEFKELEPLITNEMTRRPVRRKREET